MERLNIPLSYHSTTTRPSRRVVWLAGAFLLLAWIVSSRWFTRPDVGRAAPDGTQAIIRLQPGSEHWADVLDVVGDWPAVAGRGLTLRDLAPYTQGDLTLYFSADGDWNTAIRTSADKLPHALLDNQGIVVEDAGGGLFLLNDRFQPLVNVALGHPAPWLSSLFGRTLGDVYLRQGNAWVAGRLEGGKSGWNLRLPSVKLARLPWKTLPADTLAAIATPFPVQDLDMTGITGRMDALLGRLDVPPVQTLIDGVTNGHGFALLSRDAHGLGLLLSGPSNTVSPEDGKRLLAAAGALQTPSLKSWTLPDQTVTQELEVDPSAVSIEERTLFGTQVIQAKTRPDEAWLFATKTPAYAFSNRETLMTDWLSGKSEGTALKSTCSVNGAAFLNLRGLFAVSASSLDHQEANIVRLASERFEHITISSGLFSTLVQLCF